MIQLVQTSGVNMGSRIAALPRFQLDYESFGDLRKLTHIKSLPTSGNSRFASHLALHLPDVAERIDEYDFGILHLEVGALKLATRSSIAKRDWKAVCEHFAFVADMMEDAGTELRNALYVSYLGNLFYGETSLNYAKARSLLPKSLVRALEEIETHYECLVP